MRCISVIIFLQIFTINSFAQEINPVFNEYNFENGLSSSQITSVVQDDNNFLWIGTADGLNRYDGNTFKQYFTSSTINSIADNHINTLAVMRNNVIAIGTAYGLNFLNISTGLFKTFKVKDSSALNFIRNNFIKICTDKSGNLWAATQTDLYIFNAKQKLIKTISGNYSAADINKKLIQLVWAIANLPDGNIVVSFTSGERIYDANLRQVKNSEFYKVLLNKVSVLCNDQQVWYAENNKDSVFLYRTKEKTTTAYPLFKNATAHIDWFTNLFLFDENTLYTHLADTGFFKLTFNSSSSSIQHINSLPPINDVCSFLKDKQNNLWIATANGLFEWTVYKNQFTSVLLPADNKSSVGVSCFFRNENNFYAGTYGKGLYKYNLVNKTFQHYNTQLKNSTLTSMLWSLHQHAKDTLWLATQQGIVWFNTINSHYGKLRCIHPSVLDSFPITTQFTDSKKMVWLGVGVGHGIICYNPQLNTFTVYDIHSKPAFPLRHPTAITEDKDGNLWMGTQRGGGLVKWTRATNAFQTIKAKSNTTFSDDRINAMYCDKLSNSIFIGSGNASFVKYNITENTFEDIGKDVWLSHGRIININGSYYPDLWLTTEHGLHLYNATTKTFRSFFKKDGLPGNVLTSDAFFDSSNKKIYAGVTDGMIEFDPRSLLTNTALPPVIITAVSVNDSLLHDDLNGELLFNHTQNNITIDFTAVDLVNGSDLKFRYRLNDNDHWNDAGINRQIHFSNLSSSHYKLLIEVANKSGKWNTTATTLQFYIQPPFWKTNWFYCLIVIVVCLVIYLLYNFRIKQLQHVIEMRNHIAKDLHDDIGGTMTAINLTNQLAIQNLDKPVVAKRLLLNISDDLKAVSETLDDIVWTVNPTNDSMQEIMARMRRYASSTWESAGIDFSLNFDEQIAAIRLNMEQRHDLYLVFKEAVNNVAKHSKSKQASSSIYLKNNFLCVEVKDDGIGFDTSAASHRNGLKNIESRMIKLKGDLEITSAHKNGTTVFMRMPITQKED